MLSPLCLKLMVCRCSLKSVNSTIDVVKKTAPLLLLMVIAVFIISGIYLISRKEQQKHSNQSGSSINTEVHEVISSVQKKVGNANAPDSERKLVTEIDQLQKNLREAEKSRSSLLGKFDNGETSIIHIKIIKPNPIEIGGFVSKINLLMDRIDRSEFSDEVKSKLKVQLNEFGDFLHWGLNKHSKKEYDERALSVHVDPREDGGDVLSGVVTEVSGSVTGVGGGIKTVGNTSKKLFLEKQLKQRYGHLFELHSIDHE